jgi:hypothetical protein
MVLHVMDPLFDGINRKTLVGSFKDYNWIPGEKSLAPKGGIRRD